MFFHEIQFPPKIAYGAISGPEFSTHIATNLTGFEQRNINWQQARLSFDVSTGIKNKHDMDLVLAFFRARFGKAFGFRFKDWTDFVARNQVIDTGDGDTTEFQLVKIYQSGDFTYKRKIKKPVEGTVKVQSGGTYSVDHASGIITFDDAPKEGEVIIADFEFDVPVRFDTDKFLIRINSPGLFVCDSIQIVEIRM